MHIVCVCGLGMGSSLILKMTVDKAVTKFGIKDCEIEHWDAGTVDSKSPDLIVTSEDFRSRFAEHKNVVYVQNIVNNKEVEEKLRAYFEENNLL